MATVQATDFLSDPAGPMILASLAVGTYAASFSLACSKFKQLVGSDFGGIVIGRIRPVRCLPVLIARSSRCLLLSWHDILRKGRGQG